MKNWITQQLKKWQDKELADRDYKKLRNTPGPGYIVELHWKENIVDKGYLFQTPECNNDSYFVHVPEPSNPSGKDSCDPEWRHLNELLSNPQLIKIIIL